MIKAQKIKCESCGSSRLDVMSDLFYDEGTYYICLDCGIEMPLGPKEEST